ncbi:hypothetical protein [Streptomyces arboris]|uniref:hypothetical protein n=1 Tax=Streptomyces arboris TaxID=2600619 RepID=UPI00178C6A13|nr:hypothetical protein [Streptomyces arboris]
MAEEQHGRDVTLRDGADDAVVLPVRFGCDIPGLQLGGESAARRYTRAQLLMSGRADSSCSAAVA